MLGYKPHTVVIDDVNVHKGKVNKPKPNHPWKNSVPSNVAKWAGQKSWTGPNTSFLKGGGKPQK